MLGRITQGAARVVDGYYRAFQGVSVLMYLILAYQYAQL
jgi:hypothetical protein